MKLHFKWDKTVCIKMNVVRWNLCKCAKHVFQLNENESCTLLFYSLLCTGLDRRLTLYYFWNDSNLVASIEVKSEFGATERLTADLTDIIISFEIPIFSWCYSKNRILTSSKNVWTHIFVGCFTDPGKTLVATQWLITFDLRIWNSPNHSFWGPRFKLKPHPHVDCYLISLYNIQSW